jgi:hypothetical protein
MSVPTKKPYVQGCSEWFDATRRSMDQDCPIILNALLYNPDLNIYGVADMLIKGSCLSKLFPSILNQSGFQDKYYIVQLEYSTLNLMANGLNLLNNAKQKIYKLDSAILCKSLSFLNDSVELKSYVIGRKHEYKVKGQSIRTSDCFEKIGVIDLETRDHEYLDILNQALDWRNRLKKFGAEWKLNPASVPELKPNLKNDQDEPWTGVKRKIGESDVTKLWGCGVKKRKLSDDTWQTTDPENLGFDPESKGYQIIRNQIKSNLTGKNIGLDQIGSDILMRDTTHEFFIDFEAVSDLNDDFRKFPKTNSDSVVFMIGSLIVDKHGRKKYVNYLVDRLNKESELAMFKAWLLDVKNLIGNQVIKIYHWSHAERTMLDKVLGDQNAWLDSNRIELELIDLCEILKEHQCAIAGCFNYKLKDITEALRKQNKIKTTWDGDMDGKNAMVVAWRAEQKAIEKHGFLSDVKEMDKLGQYNLYDCQALTEILKYIRKLNKH